MIICPQCGVELDDLPVCPLCKSSPGILPKNEHPDKEEVNESRGKLFSDFFTLSGNQKRVLFWELSGIILFSGILVTLMIDVIITRNISWSRYTITICLVLFANFTLFSYLRHKLLIMMGGSFISTSVLLVLLDMYNNKIGWGSQLGIPLLLALYLIILILTILIKKARQQGFNILGCFFLASGVYSLCIEVIVSYYLHGLLVFHWSPIVLASVIPIAVILFFIHYRLKKGIELRRFFHI